MSGLRQIRSFSVEMMKLAADIQDAGIRDLLARRRGEEYLPGGELPNNSSEAKDKVAFGGSYGKVGLTASGAYDHHAGTKKNNEYQTLRDYTTTGVKGGLTALGMLGAANAARGRFGSPQGPAEVFKATKNVRRALAGGAGVAVLDRAYRHDDLPKTASSVLDGLKGWSGKQRLQGAATGAAGGALLGTAMTAFNTRKLNKKMKKKLLPYGAAGGAIGGSIGGAAAPATGVLLAREISRKLKHAGVVRATASGLTSPAAQLSQAGATGGFKNVVHAAEGRTPHSLQIGQKFRAA